MSFIGELSKDISNKYTYCINNITYKILSNKKKDLQKLRVKLKFHFIFPYINNSLSEHRRIMSDAAMRVLVTGGSGLLGRAVMKVFQEKNWNVVGTAFSRCGSEKGLFIIFTINLLPLG